MKMIITSLLLSLLLFMPAAVSVSAGDGAENRSTVFRINDVSFTLTGTSNVRDWEITSDTFSGVVRESASFFQADVENGNPDTWFDEVHVSVPASSLDSGIGAMNQAMHSTLKSDEHPELSYELEEVKAISVGEADREYVLVIRGVAQAAGAYHQLEHEVTISSDNPDQFVVFGEFQVRFADFDLEPPSFMRGALRTDEDVLVSFRFTMVRDE
ncbi:YceI family protein [Balneolales bacterium ANBcel1]|nr:YceI family protein [Balneolales bacterium ANBcel1]